MSTPNFKTMSDFPLIVAGNQYSKFCPECGFANDDDADKCADCGESLEGVEAVYDEFTTEDVFADMETWARKMNEAQDFYEVTVESGHYSGIQFYVSEKYWHIEDMDNEESQEEFGLCRSAMLRKYESAGNKVRRMLKEAAEEMGLMHLVCVGIFSNGEAVYEKVA